MISICFAGGLSGFECHHEMEDNDFINSIL